MSDLEKPDRPVFEAYDFTINGVNIPNPSSSMFIRQLQRAAGRKPKVEEIESFLDNKKRYAVGIDWFYENDKVEKPRKPKPINYNTELKIRISSKQKDALAKISSSYGLTMSQYVRELIEKDLYND